MNKHMNGQWLVDICHALTVSERSQFFQIHWSQQGTTLICQSKFFGLFWKIPRNFFPLVYYALTQNMTTQLKSVRFPIYGFKKSWRHKHSSAILAMLIFLQTLTYGSTRTTLSLNHLCNILIEIQIGRTFSWHLSTYIVYVKHVSEN